MDRGPHGSLDKGVRKLGLLIWVEVCVCVWRGRFVGAGYGGGGRRTVKSLVDCAELFCFSAPRPNLAVN
ncbi:hypothetical protein BHE74_00028331 [Ensete ventricosum]|nr:hypothetical protein GW17_00037659 [Ensete ventricosum]RWW64435.1 hypothetical protein BHE74_00028331 [Ensete ventricosum]RZS26963.1 hypothetical protein BHM03_00060387 [Ensete ventricosum]